MASDDDLMDAYDGDSGEDYYYSGGEDEDEDEDMAELIDGADDDDNDGDYGYASDDPSFFRSEKNYSVLKESDIKQRQEESISHVSAVLSLPRVAARTLLCHYKWNVSHLHDEWFADEGRVRDAVGLLSKPIVELSNAKKVTCGICFDSISLEQIRSAFCGHPYCTTCWQGYITTSINDGPGCLLLRCPDPSCSAVVGQDMILDLSSDEDKNKYSQYLIRSYVEEKKKTKWCPAPDCDKAVEFELGSNIYDVTCLCSHMFCWNCTEEAHRPVDCSTVAQWIMKNSAEAENMNWILANSKPCPKCKRPIEKNQGCMHMTCSSPCKFEFCWLCLGVWSEHGERTGGFYACNQYEAAKQEGLYDADEAIRERAKNSLERYTHYFERWESNQKSRVKAIADLHQMRTVHLEKLSNKLKEPESQLRFILEAWQQIIECRRVLKWTYAYGYYFPQDETAKKHLFEYLQGEAEAGLERLHQCAEKELSEYLPSESDTEDSQSQARETFKSFRPKLTGLTRVTRSYFENLMRALENGLEDVNSQATSSAAAPVSSKNATTKRGKGKSSSSSRSGGRDIDDTAHWNCDMCTFANPESTSICEMCQSGR